MFLMSVTLSACASVEAVTAHSHLTVNTKMSETVFLDPVAPDQRTIYLGIRNTSGFPSIDFKTPLMHALEARGYTLVADPDIARFELQVNVLQAGRIGQKQVASLLAPGWDQPLMRGSVPGGMTPVYAGNIPVGLVPGLGLNGAPGLLDQIVGDVTYAVTTDIRLSERPVSGLAVHQFTRTSHESPDNTGASLPDGTTDVVNSNARYQEIDEPSAFKTYHVRETAYADQVNLTARKAIPILENHLASSLANLFE